ncbi:ABC transporter ATP-binding protein [Tichowtungia aerotolerans]|uniref:ATP-binding cassette domain-containing protein n=1 Tax=Tichowtungia aerotolerans TaxID=2697043 RepID=A0A6P1M0X6_9BACT|nr:ATP-binding cassette domain-containing protein [Tichowtungia aerotolerans]QHI68210.1 ATP-binding cassette domain-containing protein [Tichowtungia aerotolerans]
MIKVSNLTKRFSGYTAVDDISFEVDRGEIIGFLGPNGAGKTTTMRMLTGFLHPTRGKIEIAGCNVMTNPLEARRHIGYMPESCPLYTEMRVDEYLKFRAKIKEVPRRDLKNRLGAVKEQCGLTQVGGRIIGQLSKGYRQRVGLADSLLNEPDLLILDEPTAGLDPNQIREVRELIGRLAERHTLLLSTHILPEVEMACKRVLIIDKGKIVASDSPESLQKRLLGDAQISADILGDAQVVEDALKALESVDLVISSPQEDGWTRFTIDSASPDIRCHIFDCVVSNGWKLRELHTENRSLEDLFVTITRGNPVVEES